MTPACCDLRGLDYMPLLGTALFGSAFNAGANDSEFRAGITLLWAAWQQVPAGSLPNNDAALCLLADLGRDVDAWLKLRERALHGWVLCGDGRLYNEFLSRQVVLAWEKRGKARQRKAAWREGAKKKAGADVLRDKTGTSPGQGADVPADGTVRNGIGLKTNTVPYRTDTREPNRKTEQSRAPKAPRPIPFPLAPAQTKDRNSQQPLSKGSVPKAVALDGRWRNSQEGVQAMAAELKMPQYDPKAAQMRQAPSWSKYRTAVIEKHAESFRLKWLNGRA